MLAYVLINTEPGFTPQVLTAVKKFKSVMEVYAVYGVYDIVVKVEAESLNKLKETFIWKMRRLNNVMSTLTMIVV